jgi:hypothetical protein
LANNHDVEVVVVVVVGQDVAYIEEAVAVDFRNSLNLAFGHKVVVVVEGIVAVVEAVVVEAVEVVVVDGMQDSCN